ncbi:MAG: hypothetical protein NWE76_04110, partial [Candidatus Bathyarchaeota archaeon]|nr:hypothetical protein [Candidatus Bathyarchaeota archaeon]
MRLRHLDIAIRERLTDLSVSASEQPTFSRAAVAALASDLFAPKIIPFSHLELDLADPIACQPSFPMASPLT